jgi:hypothetical protein
MSGSEPLLQHVIGRGDWNNKWLAWGNRGHHCFLPLVLLHVSGDDREFGIKANDMSFCTAMQSDTALRLVALRLARSAIHQWQC